MSALLHRLGGFAARRAPWVLVAWVVVAVGLVVLANPRVTHEEGAEVAREGCLSIPGVVVDVERPLFVRARALDVHGDPLMIEASGLEARVIQHEVDHLDGVLMLDRTEKDQRKGALRALRGKRFWRLIALMMFVASSLAQSPSPPGLPVTYERLLNSTSEPGNWLMYSGTYNGWRFSKLNQITTENVKNLGLMWTYNLESIRGVGMPRTSPAP